MFPALPCAFLFRKLSPTPVAKKEPLIRLRDDALMVMLPPLPVTVSVLVLHPMVLIWQNPRLLNALLPSIKETGPLALMVISPPFPRPFALAVKKASLVTESEPVVMEILRGYPSPSL